MLAFKRWSPYFGVPLCTSLKILLKRLDLSSSPRMGVLLVAELINLGPCCLLFNVVVSSQKEKPNFFFVSKSQLKIASWLKIGTHVHFPLSAMGHWLDPEPALGMLLQPLWVHVYLSVLLCLDDSIFDVISPSGSSSPSISSSSWTPEDLPFRTGVPKFILCPFSSCGSLCYFSCTPRGIFFHGIWSRHQADHSLFWPRIGKSCHFTLLKQILGVQKHGYLFFFKTKFFL